MTGIVEAAPASLRPNEGFLPWPQRRRFRRRRRAVGVGQPPPRRAIRHLHDHRGLGAAHRRRRRRDDDLRRDRRHRRAALVHPARGRARAVFAVGYAAMSRCTTNAGAFYRPHRAGRPAVRRRRLARRARVVQRHAGRHLRPVRLPGVDVHRGQARRRHALVALDPRLHRDRRHPGREPRRPLGEGAGCARRARVRRRAGVRPRRARGRSGGPQHRGPAAVEPLRARRRRRARVRHRRVHGVRVGRDLRRGGEGRSAPSPGDLLGRRDHRRVLRVQRVGLHGRHRALADRGGVGHRGARPHVRVHGRARPGHHQRHHAGAVPHEPVRGLQSFHNAVARYFYSLGREGVLHRGLGAVERVARAVGRGRSPRASSRSS